MNKKKVKAISLYISPDLQKKLKKLAVEEETTITALGEEAINTLLKKRGGNNHYSTWRRGNKHTP